MLENTSVSRRTAIASSALAGLALAAPAIAHADEVSWDGEADAVVLGAGGAGDMAALRLSEKHGMSVILLEAMDTLIASSHLCGGGLTLCETAQAPGSRDILFQDLVNASQNDCESHIVQSYVDNAPLTYEALVGWGIKFQEPMQVPYQSMPWLHIVEGGIGALVMAPLEAMIAESPSVQLHTETRARKLILDEGGRVIGVEATTPDGSTKRFKGTNGVVITTGGFTRNAELAKALGPKGSNYIIPTTGPGSMGDGLLMGLAAGADISYLGAGVKPSACIGTTTHTILMQFMGNGAILVGLNGKRFHNEGDNYVLITSAAMNSLENAQMFQICDSIQHELVQGSNFEGEIEPEFIGNTLEELGEAIKTEYPSFNTEALVAEVERYNGFIDEGADADFGRIGFVGAYCVPTKLLEPPFYAMPLSPGTTHFNGGFKMDYGMRVLSACDKQPIPGLYAAGEVTGGFHGYGYMSGSAFGKAFVQGLTAADALAADAQ